MTRIPAKAQKSLRRSRLKIRADLIKNGLKVWSTFVRRRDDYTCQWCGKRDPANHAHHIVARSLSNTMGWLAHVNGVCLCYRCHIHRLKADPDAYIAWRDRWLESRGLTIEWLRVRYATRCMISTADLAILIESMAREETH